MMEDEGSRAYPIQIHKDRLLNGGGVDDGGRDSMNTSFSSNLTNFSNYNPHNQPHNGAGGRHGQNWGPWDGHHPTYPPVPHQMIFRNQNLNDPHHRGMAYAQAVTSVLQHPNNAFHYGYGGGGPGGNNYRQQQQFRPEQQGHYNQQPYRRFRNEYSSSSQTSAASSGALDDRNDFSDSSLRFGNELQQLQPPHPLLQRPQHHQPQPQHHHPAGNSLQFGHEYSQARWFHRGGPYLHRKTLLDSFVNRDGTYWQNRVTLKIDVPFTDHSHIIGRGGRNTQEVMRRTGCHIHFPDSNKDTEKDKSNQVSIAGNMNSVEKARHLLRELAPLGLTFDLKNTRKDVNLDEYLKNPCLEFDTGTRDITVIVRPNRSSNQLFVMIRGSVSQADSVKKAYDVLVEKLFEPDQRRDVQLSVALDILPEYQNFVIGPEAMNIRTIASLTQCNIHYPPLDKPIDDRPTTFFIKGKDFYSVLKARNYVIAFLPVSLSFDVDAERMKAGDGLKDIEQKHNVHISHKPKKMPTLQTSEIPKETVTIRTQEWNCTALYAARDIITGQMGKPGSLPVVCMDYDYMVSFPMPVQYRQPPHSPNTTTASTANGYMNGGTFQIQRIGTSFLGYPHPSPHSGSANSTTTAVNGNMNGSHTLNVSFQSNSGQPTTNHLTPVLLPYVQAGGHPHPQQQTTALLPGPAVSPIPPASPAAMITNGMATMTLVNQVGSGSHQAHPGMYAAYPNAAAVPNGYHHQPASTPHSPHPGMMQHGVVQGQCQLVVPSSASGHQDTSGLHATTLASHQSQSDVDLEGTATSGESGIGGSEGQLTKQNSSSSGTAATLTDNTPRRQREKIPVRTLSTEGHMVSPYSSQQQVQAAMDAQAEEIRTPKDQVFRDDLENPLANSLRKSAESPARGYGAVGDKDLYSAVTQNRRIREYQAERARQEPIEGQTRFPTDKWCGEGHSYTHATDTLKQLMNVNDYNGRGNKSAVEERMNHVFNTNTTTPTTSRQSVSMSRRNQSAQSSSESLIESESRDVVDELPQMDIKKRSAKLRAAQSDAGQMLRGLNEIRDHPLKINHLPSDENDEDRQEDFSGSAEIASILASANCYSQMRFILNELNSKEMDLESFLMLTEDELKEDFKITNHATRDRIIRAINAYKAENLIGMPNGVIKSNGGQIKSSY